MTSNTDFRAALLCAAVAAAALFDPAAAFSPSPPQCHPSTEASLFGRRSPFRRREEQNDGDDLGPSPSEEADRDNADEKMRSARNSRRSFLSGAATSAATASLLPLQPLAASAADKQYNLSNEDLKQIILSDIIDKSFLVSADITRSVYDESATFTDEIDAYTMDKWIKGTQSLFIASGSRVSLVGDVAVSPSEVSFRFDEDLMFNIPFKPVCSLTGKVVLTRDGGTGLITSYREYWDQSVNEVLKTAKFGKKV